MLIFAEMASAEMRKTKARIVLDADITIETRLHHKSQRLGLLIGVRSPLTRLLLEA
jgi:hypothetical protein